ADRAHGSSSGLPRNSKRPIRSESESFCSGSGLRASGGDFCHPGGSLMIYSYSQINQYLSCPRAYRHRYLEGWKEKDTRANLVFGRAFEQALSSYFKGEDSGQRLHDEWAKYREVELEYGRGDTWDTVLTQGVQLLERFCQEDRVRIANPASHLQVRISRSLSAAAEFVSYIDAIGELDRVHSIIEWKTTSARYSEE